MVRTCGSHVPCDAPALVRRPVVPGVQWTAVAGTGRGVLLRQTASICRPRRRGESAVDALNCFLQSGRCNCGHGPSLRPQLLPERARHAVELQLAWGHDREGERHG